MTIVLISTTKRKLEYVEGHLRNCKVRHTHQNKTKKVFVLFLYNHLQSSTYTFLSRQILCNCFAIKLNIHRTNYFQCNKIYKAKVCVCCSGSACAPAHTHTYTLSSPILSHPLMQTYAHTIHSVTNSLTEEYRGQRSKTLQFQADAFYWYMAR